ncbi:DNA adenine methylase [Nonomuraea sp. NPDC026600]|uniref:DNA adenine methylase n=1 Tax=Nonomuraea sp. NPDC026600 TaxID=3155363 RepID=UPI0034019E35
MKPPFAYYGAKVMIASKIVRLLQPHDHYVEPFAGSLSVLLAKAPSRMETVNDLDRDLMTFWRVLRDRPAELARVCALTPHGRSEHASAYDLGGQADEMERARRVWVLLTQGRAGTLRKTGWRYYCDPAGSSSSMPGYLAGYVGRMAAVAERLARVSLESRPALDLIDSYGRHEGVLLYLDPPYLGSTRARNYKVEMSSEAEHRELAEHVRRCRATVVLSGYNSPLYGELYDGWHRTEIAAATGQSTGYHARTEVLWANRPFPAVAPALFTEADA